VDVTSGMAYINAVSNEIGATVARAVLAVVAVANRFKCRNPHTDASEIDVRKGLYCSRRFPPLVDFFGVKFLFNEHITLVIRAQNVVNMNRSLHFAFLHHFFTRGIPCRSNS